MMWSTIRRKAASTGSSVLANYVNGTVQSLERARPALAGSTSPGYITTSEVFNLGRGSKLLPQVHHDAPVYSQSLRDVVPSFKRDFPMQKWVRSFSSNGGHVDRVGISEPIAEIEAEKGICNAEKMTFAEIENKASNGPIPFTLSGGLYGGLLSAPIVNSPQAASMSVGAVASPTFLPNLALFWHINNGIEEILADYVHHEMTRSLMLVLMRLFLIVAAKDVFVATN